MVDPVRVWQLVSGVVGIYVSYLVTGILHESMLKKPYTNEYNFAEEKFTWAEGFLFFPCGICWIIGALVNYFQISPENRTHIPAKNAAMCGLTVAISTLTYTYAIYLTNFPVVMMFKSCNILSVVLVGVLCSRVKDKKLKLGTKKIVVGVLVTLGIVMFKLADPESAAKDQKKTEFIGIVLLIVSLLADGFLPDFQAQIKTDYKPQPMQMMTAINKWVTIISLVYSVALFQAYDMGKFFWDHKLFMKHMIGMGLLSTVGQMFVYRMIKQFKQHFVPFVITTRKIFTVALSLVFYKHATNVIQVIGLILVLVIVVYQFVSELMSEKVDVPQPVAAPQSIDMDVSKGTDLNLQVQPEVFSQQIETVNSADRKKAQEEHYNKRIHSGGEQ